ncbi:MAG: aminotransferase class III-fold pyridoxal phosphate-dependent enzyme [Thermoleophilia bacterium]|nr:aminotransferase class III-fold pyridoxal phosphate-dependent enzyme [Thermoleophilia bacterium]
MRDVDGNEFIDLLSNFTALVHGHAPDTVVRSLHEQALMGTAFPAPGEAQASLAEAIRDRVASIELMRFTNSGSEAIMMAVRAARSFTGRAAIIKIDGGYHGSWEQVPMDVGSEASLRGIPDSSLDLLHTVPMNDVQALENMFALRGSEIAAFLIEPVMGEGVLVASDDYLAAAKELTEEYGALLVFDEVISFRLGFGGRQGQVGVKPDLTTLGKLIGGGLPVGAFGGRRDVMESFDPTRPGNLEHAGTYNGNAMTMAAGLATLDLLSADEIGRINSLGEHFTAELDRLLVQSALDGRATGCGSLTHVHFELNSEGMPAKFADMRLSSPLLKQFHRASLDQGLFFATRGLMCMSTAMDEEVVDEMLGAFTLAIEKVEGKVRVG